MMSASQPDEYRLVSVRRDSRRSLRALVMGPGTGAGVWYSVSSVRAAAALVDSLNLVLLYARELKASRAARGRSKRKIN